MNIAVETKPQSTVALRVEIPEEDFSSRRAKIAASFLRHAKVPGFRPGKAPQAVILKRYAKEIEEELNQSLVEEILRKAQEEHQLSPLSARISSGPTRREDGGQELEMTLSVRPAFTLPDYSNLTITLPPETLPESAVDAEIERLRQRMAEFETVEGRPAAMGDFLIMDYTCTLGGVPVAEALGKPLSFLEGREGYWAKLDDQAFLPGFAAAAVGISPGENRDIPLTMPEDFPVADLANRELVFHVTAREIKVMQLPEIDDEFANSVIDGKTLAEVREILREYLQARRTSAMRSLKAERVVSALMKDIEMELPEEILAEETQDQINRMVNKALDDGVAEEAIQSQQQEIFEAAKHRASLLLRSRFVLQDIAKQEKITATHNEMAMQIASLAESNKQAFKPFLRKLQREGRIGDIQSAIITSKTVDFLCGLAKVEEDPEEALQTEEN